MATAPVEFAAIVNSYNRRALLESALPSLVAALKTLPTGSAVVAFDAGSTDGSREFIEAFAAQQEGIEVILLTPSPGQGSSFADGCNAACAEALRRFPSTKWLLFFETDNCIKNPSALQHGVSLLEKQPELAGVGFTVEKANGQKMGYGCRFPGVTAFVLGQKLAAMVLPETPTAQPWQTGFDGGRWRLAEILYTSPLLLRASAWADAGPMDNERFPFTDSDVDLCWTMNERGWRFAVLDVAGVIHDNLGAHSQWTARRVMYFHKSRFDLLRKHRGNWLRWITALLLLRHVVEVAILLVSGAFSARARGSLQVRMTLIGSVLRGYRY